DSTVADTPRRGSPRLSEFRTQWSARWVLPLRREKPACVRRRGLVEFRDGSARSAWQHCSSGAAGLPCELLLRELDVVDPNVPGRTIEAEGEGDQFGLVEVALCAVHYGQIVPACGISLPLVRYREVRNVFGVAAFAIGFGARSR